MCHAFGMLAGVGDISVINTPHSLITHDYFQRGKPMDCTEENLVFFGISLVL